MPRPDSTPLRNKLTDPKVIIAFVSVLMPLVLGTILYTARAGDTAVRGEVLAKQNHQEIVQIKQVIVAIPRIEEDIENLENTVGKIRESQVREEERTASFRREQVAMSQRQSDLLERFFKNKTNE